MSRKFVRKTGAPHSDTAGNPARPAVPTVDAAIERAALIARLLAPPTVRIEAQSSGSAAGLPCDGLALDNALLSMVISALRAGDGPGTIRLGATIDTSFDPFTYARVFVEDDADSIRQSIDGCAGKRLSDEDSRIFDLLVAAQFSVETGGTLTCAGQGTAARRTTLTFPITAGHGTPAR